MHAVYQINNTSDTTKYKQFIPAKPWSARAKLIVKIHESSVELVIHLYSNDGNVIFHIHGNSFILADNMLCRLLDLDESGYRKNLSKDYILSMTEDTFLDKFFYYYYLCYFAIACIQDAEHEYIDLRRRFIKVML